LIVAIQAVSYKMHHESMPATVACAASFSKALQFLEHEIAGQI